MMSIFDQILISQLSFYAIQCLSFVLEQLVEPEQTPGANFVTLEGVLKFFICTKFRTSESQEQTIDSELTAHNAKITKDTVFQIR